MAKTKAKDGFDKLLQAIFIEKFAKRGMSQLELARRIGCDPKQVQRLLDPDTGVRSFYLMKALNELGYRCGIEVEDKADGSKEVRIFKNRDGQRRPEIGATTLRQYNESMRLAKAGRGVRGANDDTTKAERSK